MNKISTTAFVVAMLASTVSFAQGNNGGGNGGCGVGQSTNGCTPGTVGGAGGNGGNGGNGGAGGAGGAGGRGGSANAAAVAAASAQANAAAIAAQQQQQLQRQRQNQTANGGTGNGGSATGGNALSSAGSNSGGNTVNLGGDSYNVPAVASTATAPGFALGNCGWAISGGFQAFIAGASGGTAGVYDVCLKMQAAEHFRRVGQPAQAKAMECLNPDLRKAHYEAGEPCRADMPKTAPVAPVVASAAPVSTLPANCTVVQPGNYVTCN